MNRLQNVHELGQSIWYDNIQRRLLENGEMARMVEAGEIRGVTSNPSIFQNAIAKSHDYDAAIKPMAWSGWTAEQIFYQLAVEDIRSAADLFRPLYEESDGGDGYVSLEVSPELAHDGEKTAAEAKRLWDWVQRPNLMIKIPATVEGLEAIKRSIAAGININVTLIFSLARYAQVIEAYLSGLEERVSAGLPVGMIASVASFFVSRIDTKVDSRLQEILKGEASNAEKAAQSFGKAAIANASLAYALFEREFGGDRFAKLHSSGAQKQRPLWASTSTKNPAYRDVVYIEELIGKDTVNTVPQQTLEAFRDHGEARITINNHGEDPAAAIAQIEALGISMDQVTQELEREGVKAFADAFKGLLGTLEERRAAAEAELGELKSEVIKQVKDLESKDFTRRMFVGDAAMWSDDPAGQAEIRRRMGWLNAPKNGRNLVPLVSTLLQECQSAGYTHVLLLGMGGSSLAPEVIAQTFGAREIGAAVGLELSVLDSTDPAQVRAAARRSPMEHTLYVVSSKSGSTSEINAFIDFFWAKAQRMFGKRAGEHFIAITDPGTNLEKRAFERGFRRIFQGDPSVSGLHSVLAGFGLIPAVLIGLDLKKLLDKAERMADQCRPEVPAGRNPGLVLGAILGAAGVKGQDKLTLLADDEISAFGSWIEQLVAESSGKAGKGLVPVDIEPEIKPSAYSHDRLFVYLRFSGQRDAFVQQLRKNGFPVVELPLSSEYDLAAEFYRWEFAAAAASAILGVNGFIMPDVQASKNRTARNVVDYKEFGTLNEGIPIWTKEGACVYGNDFPGLKNAGSIKEVVDAFLVQAAEGDYVALNAFLPRNPNTLGSLQHVRKELLLKTKCATTLGFGPRFLHSTGQLHKGGANNGMFLMITSDYTQDIEIPGQGLSFGILERAQALGDLDALLARGRRVIRIHIPDGDVKKLIHG